MSDMQNDQKQAEIQKTESAEQNDHPAIEGDTPAPPADSVAPSDEDETHEYEEDDADEAAPDTSATTTSKRRKYRKPRADAFEQRLQGRRALCKSIKDIAPHMLKTVKLRVLGEHIDSRKRLDDTALNELITREAKKIASKSHILRVLNEIDPDVNRRNLKWIILFKILLQEETYSLEERRLEEKVIEFEKSLIERARNLDFFDEKKHDPIRWHHYDTYRIVLDAAWRNDEDISQDEAQLLRVLRAHMNISMEEHWLISTYLKRFPKQNRELHTPDDIHDARKQLQRESLLWSYRDENNRNYDIIPTEVVQVLRYDVAHLELQRTNYLRILQHDNIRLTDLRDILASKDMDRYGNKEEIIRRIVESALIPSGVLDTLDRGKLSQMCRQVGLKSSGNKSDLIERLLDFYDDLSFEERTTKDDREVLYNNYELLAARRYADLKAKKVISKDLNIEHLFEEATTFLFERKLGAVVQRKAPGKSADGRIVVDDGYSILWDCKSVENQVNLQDHLESQFDGYLRREPEKGYHPLAFVVVGPAFSPQSLKLAHQYKARTNWDICLMTASALRHLADRWMATEPNKPFPIRLFNRTELVDKEKAELLLSLA